MTETNACSAVKNHRKFIFNGMELNDPDPNMPPEKVGEFHSVLHGELTNSTLKGPTRDAQGVDVYEFKIKVGNFG
jgi:PRTRC genetic system protein C